MKALFLHAFWHEMKQQFRQFSSSLAFLGAKEAKKKVRRETKSASFFLHPLLAPAEEAQPFHRFISSSIFFFFLS
jgi:hypothetical protein